MGFLIPFCFSLGLLKIKTFYSLGQFTVFAPFLGLVTQRSSKGTSLFWAAICGLSLDLCSWEYFFGFHSLSFTAALFFLYKFKRFFSEDYLWSLCLFTVPFSLLLTIFQLILIALKDSHFPFTGKGLFSDTICMSLLDGLYAFTFFSIPLKIFPSHFRSLSQERTRL